MCELLVKAQDGLNGVWLRGRIVTIMPDGHVWGLKEAPPDFYIVKVTGVSVDAALQYLEEWHHRPRFTQLTANTNTDVFSYRMDVDVSTVKGHLTLTQVENYFTRWGCVITDHDRTSVTFDANIFALATSQGFWQKNLTGISFSDSYNGTRHEITVTGAPSAAIERLCKVEQVTYVAPNKFRINRNQARQKMCDDIYQKFQSIVIDRRRWYLSPAAMAALEGNGGVMTVTPAQLTANLRDGRAD